MVLKGRLTNHLQVNRARDATSDRESSRKVKRDKIDRGTDNQDRNLCDKLSRDKRKPMIRLGLLLSILEKVSVSKKERLKLVDSTWRNKDKVEDGHQP